MGFIVAGFIVKYGRGHRPLLLVALLLPWDGARERRSAVARRARLICEWAVEVSVSLCVSVCGVSSLQSIEASLSCPTENGRFCSLPPVLSHALWFGAAETMGRVGCSSSSLPVAS